MNELERRIVELSYRYRLTHISSCLNTVNVLNEIYAQRQESEPVVVANGHAGLSLYVVLESLGKCDAEKMIEKHGVHPSRDMANGIWCSSGSLGQVETVAVGMALADKNRTVWLVTSDGAAMEGAVCEAMRFQNIHCPNLKTFIVFNGLGAYGTIERWQMPFPRGVKIVDIDQEKYPIWLRGLPGHYLTLTEEQYQELMNG